MLFYIFLLFARVLGVQFAEHFYRFQFREIGQVEAVIGQCHLQEAVALLVRHPVEVHRRKIHAHHHLYLLRLLGHKEVMVQRRLGREDALPQVEVVARGIVVEVGIEAQEPAQAHEEHQVEIGIAGLLAVEPEDAVGHIVVEGGILLFSPQGMIKKFRDKEGDGKFVGIEGDGGKGDRQPEVADLLQLHLRAYVGLYLQHRQGLEILFTDPCLRGLGQTDDERKSAVLASEEIDNQSGLAVLDGMEHNGGGFCKHLVFVTFGGKGRKKK